MPNHPVKVWWYTYTCLTHAYADPVGKMKIIHHGQKNRKKQTLQTKKTEKTELFLKNRKKTEEL